MSRPVILHKECKHAVAHSLYCSIVGSLIYQIYMAAYRTDVTLGKGHVIRTIKKNLKTLKNRNITKARSFLPLQWDSPSLLTTLEF